MFQSGKSDEQVLLCSRSGVIVPPGRFLSLRLPPAYYVFFA